MTGYTYSGVQVGLVFDFAIVSYTVQYFACSLSLGILESMLPLAIQNTFALQKLLLSIRISCQQI